jgi:alkylation response protein AidB-like acyl-CoA dehydrogenase
VDFALTEEQRLAQETVRAFVDEHVLPVAVQNDIDHRLDLDLVRGMADLGILGIVVPEEYGGAGLDFVAEALVCEEIERGEAAFRTLISVHVGLNSLSLLRYASEEQKQRWLVPQAKGQKLACFGLTEPGAGSDVAALRTTARREGDVYVLDGQKNWISYASVADHALVFAKTDPAAAHKGISAFVVEKGTPGFEVGKIEDKMGLRASETAELVLEDCRVPHENLLGGDDHYRGNEGFMGAMKTFDASRPTIGAMAVGIARAAYDYVREFVRDNYVLARPIPRYAQIATLLADASRLIDASRLMCWRAAWMADEGMPNAKEASMAKAYAARAAMKVCSDAVQIMGAHGLERHQLVEKWYRDIKVFDIFEGTAQIQRVVISKRILREPPSF